MVHKFTVWLYRTRGRNGFVCLEQHVLKERIQTDPTSMYSVTQRVSVGGGSAPLSFRWAAWALSGERTRTGSLRPLQKIGPVDIGLPEKKARKKAVAG